MPVLYVSCVYGVGDDQLENKLPVNNDTLILTRREDELYSPVTTNVNTVDDSSGAIVVVWIS